MDEFQKEVIDRLARLEVKIDNGMGERLLQVEKWIGSRRMSLGKVVGICGAIFGAFKVADLLGHAAGWW